jgi:hypothetical protein
VSQENAETEQATTAIKYMAVTKKYNKIVMKILQYLQSTLSG